MNTISKLLAATAVFAAALGAAHADELAAYPAGAQSATGASTVVSAAPGPVVAIGEAAAYPGRQATGTALTREDVRRQFTREQAARTVGDVPAYAGQASAARAL